MKAVLRRFDANLISGSALLSLGMILARVFGLAFSLVLAAALSPEAFGAVQYGLTAGQILAIGAQPFGQHVLAWFVGRYHRHPERLSQFLSSGLCILGGLVALTLLVASFFPSPSAEVAIGALTVAVGFSAFYAYWGLATGLQSPLRLTAVYLGSNIVQIILTLLLFYGLQVSSPLVALMIYGLSYFVPLALAQWLQPLPVRVGLAWVDRGSAGAMIRFAGPIWVSHACFTLATTLDVLLLQHFCGAAEVGTYTVARTMALVFGFVPTSIAALLMPRIAGASGEGENRSVGMTLALSILVNGAILIVYLLLAPWFVATVFGAEYVTDLATYVLLAVSGMLAGVSSIITAVVVGRGQPDLESFSRLAALFVSAGAGWVLVPLYGTAGAAGAVCASTATALAVYLVALLEKQVKP